MTGERIICALQSVLELGRRHTLPIPQWIEKSISRKLLVALALVLAVSSLVFLVFFVGIYSKQLEKERANALDQVSRLLQVSLENAMLKRDLAGLRDIVDRLAEQPEILDVMIINPSHEVRFSSDKTFIGQQMRLQDLGCPGCTDARPERVRMAQFIKMDGGRDVLRSVNPVMNRKPCTQCHGDLNANPVNGVLIVDHDAGGIRHQAFLSAATLTGAGACVVLLALTATWLILRQTIIAPIAQLKQASGQLAAGNFRVSLSNQYHRADEIGTLCTSFSSMAAQIERNLEAIRGNEAFLQALIDTIPDGVRVIDADYRIVMANEAYRKQVQDFDRELIGTPCFAVHGRTEPCVPTMITCPFHVTNADGQTLKYIHRHQRSDGTELQVEITAARLTTIWNGKPCTLIIEVCRDLAEQVRYSQEQRLAELGQLAAGVAHEIYNPLASIRLGLQSLHKKIDRGQDISEQIAKYLMTVDTEVDKCIEITKRLLTLSMPPSEKLQLVSFTTIIPEILSLLEFEAERSNIRLNVDLGTKDLRIVARDSELRMLILNIVQNAFHAMPSGGELFIRGQIQNGQVEIGIRDTGVGIAPEDLPRIFDPFFSKRADGVGGTGLGLTISKAIVARYKGELRVRSASGSGAHFTIILLAANDGSYYES